MWRGRGNKEEGREARGEGKAKLREGAGGREAREYKGERAEVARRETEYNHIFFDFS